MKIGRKTRDEIADRFEGALDHVARLDPIKFHLKRKAAEVAATLVANLLEGASAPNASLD